MLQSILALEAAEIEAAADQYRAASPEVVAAGGLSLTEVAGGILLAVNRIDVLALNRLIGTKFKIVTGYSSVGAVDLAMAVLLR